MCWKWLRNLFRREEDEIVVELPSRKVRRRKRKKSGRHGKRWPYGARRSGKR